MTRRATPPLDAAGGQVLGQRRRQEDAWALKPFGERDVLAVVADGLGGHPAGDVASQAAVETLCEGFARRRRRRAGAPRRWLQEATVEADAHLRQLQQGRSDLRGMATTLVALYLRDHEFWAATVGDSYLLLRRGGQLVRLNELHSESGGVTSCLGFHLTRIDLADALPVQDGDRYLLATDGIATLDDDEVGDTLASAPDARSAVDGLLRAIADSDQPAQDNVTVVAVFCGPAG